MRSKMLRRGWMPFLVVPGRDRCTLLTNWDGEQSPTWQRAVRHSKYLHDQHIILWGEDRAMLVVHWLFP